jgi:hypothetical protein
MRLRRQREGSGWTCQRVVRSRAARDDWQAGAPAEVPDTGEGQLQQLDESGPSIIVKGFYASGNLTAIHHAYSKALKAAGYTITHEEQDAADSEVVWKGHGKTGQVALAKRCTSRILITIPVRPAG